MQVLHERFADNPNINVLGIHVDNRQDPPKYLKDHKYTYNSIPMTDDLRRFGVTGIPTFFVLGPDGAILHKHVGAINDAKRDEIARIAEQASR